MITDIFTVLWKELKEVLHKQPALRGGWIGVLIIIALYGIFLPYQAGPSWVSNPGLQLLWLWLPFLMVSNVVADTIAGERERHTLETLLASRLSDTAILLGKIASAVAYGWGITLAGILAGLITVNVTSRAGKLLLFSPEIAVGLVALTFLSALLSAGLGVLISLRAATVRQAQQTMGLVGFIPFFLILIVPMLPADIRNSLTEWFMTTSVTIIGLTAVAVLLAADIALILIALLRFQRSKLILD
jgi:ABC-2 type transport system permease protein